MQYSLNYRKEYKAAAKKEALANLDPTSDLKPDDLRQVEYLLEVSALS